MNHDASGSHQAVALGILGGVPGDVADTSTLDIPGQSIEVQMIRSDESLSRGLGRIRPDCLMLVYRGFDDRVEVPVDIAVPTYLILDVDGLTGYSCDSAAERLSVEKGLAQLRSLAPSVSLAIAPSESVATHLRDSCGFRAVVVAGEGGSIAEIPDAFAALGNAGSRDPSNLAFRVEGPFDSTYSLAVVNAGLALALANLESAACALDVAPGDQVAPAGLAMLKNPQIAKLWTYTRHLGRADAVIRNCYPPLPEGIDARGRYLYFFWEDSLISPEWTARFNAHLTGVLAPTRHVEKVLRDSGVVVPIGIVPCGLPEEVLARLALPTPLPTSAGFRFLHVSSGFPRKGVDVLLDAYFAEFSSDDDVCMIVKTFPNIHNTTAEYLADLRRANPTGPEVVCIERDTPDYQYHGLFCACDCFVSATRCEGFGLPMAEAMAFGLPVIVTDYSGHVDFCDEQTAYMVESTLVETGSHLKVPGSMWAEPSRESLGRHMRFVFENRDGADVAGRVGRARSRASQLTWHNSALAAAEFVRSTLES